MKEKHLRTAALRFAVLAAVLAASTFPARPAGVDAAGAPPPAPAGGPSATRGPYLQLATPTSIVVRWRTDVPTDSRVRYGTAAGRLDHKAGGPAQTTEHSVTITGLKPETTYYYAVGAGARTLAGGDPSFAFTTPPPPGASRPTRIWVLGDPGTADASARAVRDAYVSHARGRRTDVWLVLGDIAYERGTDREFQAALFETFPDFMKTTVLWPTFGNHDAVSSDAAGQTGPYFDIFTLPADGQAGGRPSGTEAYYSFDHGDVHFVGLDSSESDRSADGPMMTWLRRDLASSRSGWTIAFWHHPPYSKGSHDSDSEKALVEMRENALPILDAAGVDLVLSGHSHSYERSFLLHGHYGASRSLAPAMKVDAGDGREDGDGAYEKRVSGPGPARGTVYLVTGTGGVVRSGAFNHPAIHLSLDALGSVVIDVEGDRLEGSFIDVLGAVRDRFILLKPGRARSGAAGGAGGARGGETPERVPEPGRDERGRSRVGEAVRERLAAGGSARVIVYLDVPAAAPGEARRRSARRAREIDAARMEVARAQDDLLTGLEGTGFALRRRFAAVPALAGDATEEVLRRLSYHPRVLRVDLDDGGRASLAEAVPLTNSDQVQAMGYTGSGVVVGIVDTGVDTDHPDLAGDLDDEACFCSGGFGCCPNFQATQTGPGAAEDAHGHGSNVAGVVTSDGSVAPKGVAPDARVVAVRVMDANAGFCCVSDVVAGLDWILANHPEVRAVNLSLGTFTLFPGDCDNADARTLAFTAAIANLRANGTIVFASSGNEGSGTRMTAPACVADAISVGAVWDADVGVQTVFCTEATTAADKVTCFSNSDSETDLFAPGAPITSASKNGGTSTFFGTSQAAPHAAGCAADLIQAEPALRPDAIEALLEGTGVSVTDPKNGRSFPRVDCLAALDALQNTDADADGVSDYVDVCPGLYNPSQVDTDGDGEGDLCDLFLTDPLEGQILDCRSGALPPTITWSPHVYEKYRVFVSWSPFFSGKRRVTSGDTLLRTAAWTVPARKWAKACSKAAPYLYVKVLGVDVDVPKRSPGRKVYSAPVTAETLF